MPHEDAPNTAQRVIAKFGSQSALAEALGTKQSTIGYWAKTGRIPSKWHAKILEAAAHKSISLDAGEMVTLPRPEIVPEGAADLPLALYEGDLSLGDEGGIRCYVLSDGRRVISRTSATSALSGIHAGGDLASYVKVQALAPYLKLDLEDELIAFKLQGVTHKQVFGITAETFLEICKAYVAGRDDDALTTERQNEIALQASAFLAACSKIGLIGLIDEATGYQYARSEDELRVKLRAYLEDEMRPWAKTFPDELWVEFGRLTGWKGSIQNRPKYWGKLVNELVYEYLDPDVAQWLKDNAPEPRKGRNYHQWLSSQYGLKKLMEHLWMLIGMASACGDIAELRYRMALKYGKHPVQITLYLDPPSQNDQLLPG